MPVSLMLASDVGKDVRHALEFVNVDVRALQVPFASTC